MYWGDWEVKLYKDSRKPEQKKEKTDDKANGTGEANKDDEKTEEEKKDDEEEDNKQPILIFACHELWSSQIGLQVGQIITTTEASGLYCHEGKRLPSCD